MKKSTSRLRKTILCTGRLLGLAVAAVWLGSGCVVWRGVDFGHWARTGEKIPLVKVFSAIELPEWQGDEQFLVLPPQGANIDPQLMALVRRNLMNELRNYLPINVLTLADEEAAGGLLDRQNLVVAGSVMDPLEASRLASLVNASHVLMVFVQEFRPYPPQKIALRLMLVDVASQKAMLNLDAVFDAKEQQVVMALAEHLQSRRARRFDVQNLEVMLQSPTEFSDFASARCADAMARELNFNAGFKKRNIVADKGR